MVKRRITQHKKFAPYGTYPNPDFVGTSFMLESLSAHCGQERRENKEYLEDTFKLRIPRY